MKYFDMEQIQKIIEENKRLQKENEILKNENKKEEKTNKNEEINDSKVDVIEDGNAVIESKVDVIEDDGDEDSITKRSIIAYDERKERCIKRKMSNCINDILNNHDEGKSNIHENQENCAKDIVSILNDRTKINIMIVALTQSGKTGTMNALIKEYLSNETNIIPIENIYIITGLSSKEWVDQTRDRAPESIEKRVFHRGNLNRAFINDIKDKTNVLIIMDEIQVAAKYNQSIHKSFNECGFYDIDNLLKKDIKIVEFTATPDGTLYDLMGWGEHSSKIQMQPGVGYTSCFDLYNSGKIKQYNDICCYDKESKTISPIMVQKNISELIEDIKSFDTPKYHIIRTPNALSSQKVIENFKNYYDENLKYLKYDADSFEDINNILETPPQEHFFIFIKEKLRCAKTLTKEHIGVVYERYTKNPDDSVIIQGLLGRLTGYDYNGISICYTNMPSIEKYRKLWESEFEDKTVKWNSKTTAMKKGEIRSTGTYNTILKDTLRDYDKEPTIIPFKRLEDVKEYFKNVLNKKDKFKNTRGPNIKRYIKSINEDGFYVNNLRGKNKVMSFDEIENNKSWGINDTYKYRLHPCYENVNDNSTLEFWLIYYDDTDVEDESEYETESESDCYLSL